ncbi:spvB-domain-containing protein [Colletotrichum tofieldiae]|nr:spvB-domain-containing protein [Colletotrichum tofieldiae]
MANPPLMDMDDVFTFERIRFLDWDGSGITGIVYLLPHGGATVYLNRCGNSWSESTSLPPCPRIEHLSTVFTLDILSKGTSCLCWTRPDVGGEPVIHYLDLMEAEKPHLLTLFTNGMGLETRVSYRLSIKFYLHDERIGRPWTTKLPFPVHVVSKVMVHDKFSLSSRITKYAYHDGFFDGHDKEFRGFAMVEIWERDEFQLTTGEIKRYKRPVHHKKIWFHTGSTELPSIPQGHLRHPWFKQHVKLRQAGINSIRPLGR